MKTIYQIMIFATILLLLNCVPAEFKYSLSSPENAIADLRLNGLWASSDNNKSYLFFQSKSDSMMDFIWINNKDKNQGADVFEFEIFPTKVNELDLLNLRMVINKNNDNKEYYKSYFIAKYDIQGNKLKMSYINDTNCKDLINKGMLKGEIVSDSTGSEKVFITDSSDRIITLIKSSYPDNLFEDFGEFQKIN